jgi:hypothetical protein
VTAEPPTEALVTGPGEEGSRPAQDRGEMDVAEFVGLGQLDVVDLAAEPALTVDELSIEQAESGVDDAAGGHHAPALVMIMSGIVASEISRNDGQVRC